MKNIAILGSTGSIGLSTLDVAANLGKEYRVCALAARSNWKKLLEQARRFRPDYVTLYDETAASMLEGKLPPGTKLLPAGLESLMEIASGPGADIVVSGLSGGIGFAPLVAAIKAGKTIALANKEPIVMAGPALMAECRRWNARIVPVDSEPSAIFQCLEDKAAASVSRIFLTASGGPFFNRKGSLDNVSPKEAVSHPRWNMGPKISVDSATLMNKGFEAIEISALFSLELEKIHILIHPQSIIHSAVEYADNSVLAQLSWPDMRIPIQYAITYPQRRPSPAKPLDLCAVSRLEFCKPDFRRFPCLALAQDSARKGGGHPAVLSAADEVAVSAFLSGAIKFTDIARVVEKTLSRYRGGGRPPSIPEAVEIDGWARQKAQEIISSGAYKKTAPGKVKC
ncbi:MAG: 1-deoxy-D-xylulose-5-phosphate reductoisomerase [Elusimicrobiales bacterium]